MNFLCKAKLRITNKKGEEDEQYEVEGVHTCPILNRSAMNIKTAANVDLREQCKIFVDEV